MSRIDRTRIYIATLFLSVSLPSGTLAQSEGVPVPLDGAYDYAVVLDHGQAGRLRIPGPKSDSVQVLLDVSICGDRITVHNSQFPTPLQATYGLPPNPYGWYGQVEMEPGATISLWLDPESNADIAAKYRFDLPAMEQHQVWNGNMRMTPTENDPSGEGVIDAPTTLETTRRMGLWHTQTVRRNLVLWDFVVNENDLLSKHQQVIEDAADIMMSTNWQPDGSKACQLKPSLTSNMEILGTSSITGPETHNQNLGYLRAQNVANYLRQALAVRRSAGGPHLAWLGDRVPPFGAAADGDGELIFRNLSTERNPENRNFDRLETGCFRTVFFSFDMAEVHLEMYTADSLRQWFEQDLEQIKSAFPRLSSLTALEAVLEPQDPTAELNYAEARRKARSKFVLGMNFLELIREGNCNIPGQRDPRREAVTNENACESVYGIGANPGCIALNSHEDPRTGLSRAVEVANNADRDETFAESNRRSANDPWYRASFGPNDRASAVADREECRIFGTSLRENTGPADAPEDGRQSVFLPCEE